MVGLVDWKPSQSMANRPQFEHINTNASETFLWRLDDYPWQRNVWNFHPECEIHLIRNASGVALIGDHICQFDPGHLALVGSGLPHNWVSQIGPTEVIRGRDIVLQFDPERITRAASELPELMLVKQLIVRAQRGLVFKDETRRIGAELLEAMGQASGLGRLTLFLQLLQVLAQSKDYEIVSSESFSPNRDENTVEKIRRALTYCFENFHREIKLADLAAISGMSETAFSRFFKKNSGNTFTDHITKLRIGRACQLLAESSLPVTDICFAVGYTNLSNFNRTFRSQCKMTPLKYRGLAKRRFSLV